MAALAAVTLYDHVAELEQILLMLECIDDEDTLPEYRERLEGELVASIASTREKIDRTSAALAAMEAAEVAAQLEIVRLQTRKTRIARQRERLEGYVLMVLAAGNLAKLDGCTSTLAPRQNPPSVFIEEGAQVPAEYLRLPKPPEPAPDKTLIKQALQRGIAVNGCRIVQKIRLVRS